MRGGAEGAPAAAPRGSLPSARSAERVADLSEASFFPKFCRRQGRVTPAAAGGRRPLTAAKLRKFMLP